MKNLYLKMFSLLLLGFIGITSYAQEWNISSASFNALDTIHTTATVEGLTMYSITGALIIVDANGKTIDGFTFTHRLKLGGSGTFDAAGTTPISRVVAFSVTGNTTITVKGMSSTSTADRVLVIAAGNKTTEVGRFTALGASISSADFTYTGGPTTIFLFSTASGINLYYIKATALITGINDSQVREMKIFPNPARENVSINVNEPSKIGIYNSGGILMKQQLANPSDNTINISDLNPGLYFVKTMNNNKTAQKLIIR
jgi:hypothetical protein